MKREHQPLERKDGRRKDPKRLTSEQQLLAEQHAYRVPTIARLIQKKFPHVDFEELVSEGYNGLTDAAGKYSAAAGHQFTTYATYRIQGAMLDYVRHISPHKRTMQHMMKKISEAEMVLAKEDKMPTPETLAKRLDISPKKIAQALQLRNLYVASLDSVDPQNPNTSEMKHVSSDIVSPEDAVLQKEQLDRLERAISNLNERDQTIINWYLGNEKNMREIAAELHITESRVSQIIKEIGERLQRMMEKESRNKTAA